MPPPGLDKGAKQDLIEHLTLDHYEDLVVMARAFTSFKDPKKVGISDVTHKGLQLLITDQHDQTMDQFVPFLLHNADLRENIVFLVHTAMVRLGLEPTQQKLRYFKVYDIVSVTPNMVRLVLRSLTPLPKNSPGYAFLFSLGTLHQAPQSTTPSGSTHLSKWSQWKKAFTLWRLRKVSAQERKEKMFGQLKDTRYFTLRAVRTVQEGQESFEVGDVDIFLHGDTPSGLWIKTLKKGSVINSVSEIPEQYAHLWQTGQALLVADETALPTVAALLEQWKNPVSPYVVCITQEESEQAYLPDEAVQDKSKLFRVVGKESVGQQVVDFLKTLPVLDLAWGSLEKNESKVIRYYLREERNMDSKTSRLKAYWSKDKK